MSGNLDALELLASSKVRGSRRRLVLALLALHANGEGLAWPGTLKLAEEAGADRRDVRADLRILAECGELEIVRSSRGGRSNVYRVVRLTGGNHHQSTGGDQHQSPTGGNHHQSTGGRTGGATGGRTGGNRRHEQNGTANGQASQGGVGRYSPERLAVIAGQLRGSIESVAAVIAERPDQDAETCAAHCAERGDKPLSLFRWSMRNETWPLTARRAVDTTEATRARVEAANE